MRHNVAGKKLGRDTSHRKSLLRNMSASLFEHGAIETTLPKAKYLRPFAERLITKGKKGGLMNMRLIRARLGNNEDATRNLIENIAPKFKDRNGGYTRIIKLGRRDGDNADMARIELVLDEKPVEKKPVKKETKKEVKLETKFAVEEMTSEEVKKENVETKEEKENENE